MRVLWLSNFTSSQPLEDRNYIQLVAHTLRKKDIDLIFCHESPMTIHYGEKYLVTEWRGLKTLYPMRNLISTIRDLNPNVVLLNSFNANIVRELEDINREFPTAALPTDLLNLNPLLSVDHAIAQSENAKNVLEALGCEDITVIPPSIGPRSITECSDPTIVTLSSITPIKNHIVLIEAVNLVRKNISDVELALVGQGNLKPMCEQMIELLNLETQVKIISQVGLNNLFREIRIMALPSFSETAPFSILEAYARGVPCVVSKSGWGDMFKTALKANSDDPREWADHLTNLLSDWDLYNEMRKKQLNEVKEKFSPGNIEGYVHVFEELDELNRYKIKRVMKKVEA